MLETLPSSGFGPQMYQQRTQIERTFALLASSKVGLDSLPTWVRTLRRVRLWVDAMIAIYLIFACPAKDLQR